MRGMHRCLTWALALSLALTGVFAGVAQASDSGGTISGTVTTSDGGTLAGADFVLHRRVSRADGSHVWVGAGGGGVASDGSYTTGLLPPDTYRIAFHVPSYAPVYYPAAGSVEDGQDIVVTSGDRAGINATVVPGGTISGTIRTLAGDVPATDDLTILLERRTTQGRWSEAAIAGQTGDAWRASRLPAGSYRITFYYEGPDGIRLEEYWDDQSDAALVAAVPVESGATVGGLHVVLDRAAPGTTLTPSVVPTVSGVPRLGETLTAQPGTWPALVTGFRYSWLADGTPIPRASGSTYVPTEADGVLGRALSVTVEAVGKNGSLGRVGSAQTATVTADLRNVVRPRVFGKARVGQRLVAKAGTWSPSRGVTFRFQWFAGARKIKGATQPKLRLTRAHRGKRVLVRVTASYDGSRLVVRSRPTARVAA